MNKFLAKLHRFFRISLLKIIYNGSVKKFYLCDYCKKIHRREDTDLLLNDNYGVIVSNDCSNELLEKVRRAILVSEISEMTVK